MRELFAVEFRSGEGANADAWPIIERWLGLHLEGRVLENGTIQEPGVVRQEEDALGARLAVLTQTDTGDSSLQWSSEIGIGAPTAPLHLTIRVGLSAADTAMLAPASYDFATPAVVRSVLRDVPIFDGDMRVTPNFTEIGTSRVGELVALLKNVERRLPLILVTRTKLAGSTNVNEKLLAKELAGLAHVWVLSMDQAAWELSSAISPALSAWDGSVRVYFPGFKMTDNPFRHRLWLGARVSDHLIGRLRGWFGALGSSRTVEHPVIQSLRDEARTRLIEASEHGDPSYLAEYAEIVERENAGLKTGLKEHQARVVELEDELESANAELEDVRRSFAEITRALAPADNTRIPDTRDHGDLTVSDAIAAVSQLLRNPYYSGKVRVTDAALAAGRRFDQYHAPEELLRAVKEVIEAGVLYHESRLGESPSQYFARRGFGYGTHPSPHLKADEHTSPNQCLRIYWDEDSQARIWTVTDIGRHR
jgi:hypothetical protein